MHTFLLVYLFMSGYCVAATARYHDKRGSTITFGHFVTAVLIGPFIMAALLIRWLYVRSR